MTLGQYIDILESVDNPDRKIKLGLGCPHSWRGDPNDLAFEPVLDTTVSEMLESAKSAVGRYYGGHKGGPSYRMARETIIHIDFTGKYTRGGEAINMLFTIMFGEQ